jgi:hypothetical protein
MKKVLVLLTLLISFNLISQNLGWRINKLPGDNFKITNQDDILNSWTAFLNADGTYTYVNDRDPLQSFSEKINFDGSVTTVNDFNVLESFTTRYNSFNDTFSITDDFDPLNSSTARTNFDGSVTVTDDFDPLNSSTARTNFDGSVTVTDDFPNSNISDNIGFVITNPTRSSSTGPDLDLIQGAADVANSGTVNIDYDSPEWTAAGYGIALLISTPIEQRGGNRSIGLTVGYNGGITAGLDLFFDKVSVGAHYGSKLMEDNDLVFVNEIVAAGTLGFKVSDNLYIKGGIGSYYDQVDIWSYGDGADQYLNTYQNDGKTYFQAGIQTFFITGGIALIPEIYFSNSSGIGISFGIGF